MHPTLVSRKKSKTASVTPHPTEVARGLERCAEENLTWARGNAVRFETAKTEAVLLSRRRSHGRAKRERRVIVDWATVPFAAMATRWLGVWLDSALTLRESRRRSLGRARAAEASVRRMVSRHGPPPVSARNFQNAIVSGTMLYAAELTWDGSNKMEGEVQRTLNRMGRLSLGVRLTTPLRIVTAESGLTPARALLDFRQARFALRLMPARRTGEVRKRYWRGERQGSQPGSGKRVG